jgi:hypothetical protein
MTRRASNLSELCFSEPDSRLAAGIPRYDAAGDGKGSLKHAHRGNVGARHLFDETVAVRVRPGSKALRRLNAVMVIKGIVAEFAQ